VRVCPFLSPGGTVANVKSGRARRFLLATAASVSAVALVTGLIALIEPHVPVLSLGVLYIFAVLPVAVVWGLWFALPVSVASMLAFNWFFLPPRHTFTLEDGENWFALAVYLATAVVVSHLAARARRRAVAAEQRERESALLAELASELLAGRKLGDEVGEIADRAAHVLGVRSAWIDLGPSRNTNRTQVPYPLEVSGQQIGTIYMPTGADPSLEARSRFLPALAALLAVAAEREQLENEALEAEMLRRSDLVKTTLLRAVSHDLRSPLTGVRTAIGALRNPTLNLTSADREDLLETIELESSRLGRIVGDLLDLSRLEAGADPPDTEAWDLADLVRQTVDTLDGHDRVEVAGETPVVEVDATQLQRALANLLENALKFSPADASVHVRITATRKEAIVRVVDHGPGLEPGELERVFDPFHRREGDPRAGAGLGLAIARGFVEANGGRLWAESRPGQGATFAVALPVAEVPAGLVR
jgi:two-component system, OmpR family, sensor histidine kinase KdpD